MQNRYAMGRQRVRAETPVSAPLGWGVAVLAAVPVTAFLFIAYAGLAPRNSDVVNLSGEWKALPTSTPGLEDPRLRDDDWRAFSVPGGYASQGFSLPHVWLRKHLTVPPAWAGEGLLVVLGDTRSGHAAAYFNGIPIGEAELGTSGRKTELSGIDAWIVPASAVRAGSDNVLALRFHWAALGQDGIRDARAHLGQRRIIEGQLHRNESLRRFIQQGSIGALAFLLAFFLFALNANGDAASRALYRASAALVACTLLYVVTNAGLLPSVHVAHPAYLPTMYLAITGLALTFPEWAFAYDGRGETFRRTGRFVAAGFLVAYLAAILVDRWQVFVVLYTIQILYILSVVVFMAVFSLRQLIRRKRSQSILVASAVLITAISAGFDLVRDLGVLPGYRLFPVGLAFTTIVASGVLVADFVRIAGRDGHLRSALETSNRSLHTALTQAQESSRLKSEFVATVSHELRTPLNAIINVPEGLLEGFEQLPNVRCEACSKAFSLEPGESPPSICPACQAQGRLVEHARWRYRGNLGTVASNLDRIHRSGRNLLALINDLLDFSRLEGKETQLVHRPLDLREVLHGTANTLEDLAQRSGIRIRLELPAEEATVDGDLVKLSQIFVNLLGNALKFSPGDSEVALRLEPFERGWRASVVDRGIGIAPEHHDAIFESFRQVDGSETRKFGGTGLGLAITKRLVELHGGRIWAESALNRGSTFHVDLPT